MKHYLRFGEIPESGKSVNFLKMGLRRSEDFNYCMSIGDIEGAFECVPEDAFEEGISVFSIDKNGMPELSNLQLACSMLSRIDDAIYEVTGEEIDTGNDGEPILKDTKIVKRRRIRKEKLFDHVLSVLISNFRSCEFNEIEDCDSNKIYRFYRELAVNKATGEKVVAIAAPDDGNWVRMPGFNEYCFKGWTFSDPVPGFCVDLGIKR